MNVLTIDIGGTFIKYAACPYDVPRAEVVTCKFQNDANLVGALQCFLLS